MGNRGKLAITRGELHHPFVSTTPPYIVGGSIGASTHQYRTEGQVGAGGRNDLENVGQMGSVDIPRYGGTTVVNRSICKSMGEGGSQSERARYKTTVGAGYSGAGGSSACPSVSGK